MRRFFAGIGLAVSGALSLAFIAIATPLLAAMRVDREERNRIEALERVAPYPYDDNDPGVDVDARASDECDECGRCPDACARGETGCPKYKREHDEDEIMRAHDEWHEWHGTSCGEALCVDFERVRLRP